MRSLISTIDGYDNIWFMNNIKQNESLVNQTLQKTYNLSHRENYYSKYGGMSISLFERRNDISLDRTD